jgi:hypothetical protein
MEGIRKLDFILIAMLITTIFVPLSYTRMREAKSDNKFYNYLMKQPLGVAMFYLEDKETKKDKDYQRKMNNLERIFEAIGKQGYYKEGGVQFIKANTRYDTIDELAKSFSISTLPAFILFKNGVAIKDELGNFITLTGWITYDQLEKFIREHLKDDIEKNIKQRAERIRQIRELERLSYIYYRPYFYWGYGPYWGYPYWGYGRGWYGGCGWRCGRCW